MRPLKLTMQAFGPYAGMQPIDFEDLGDNSLFLIAGTTGSGKTTILDGMAYALYGETSGGGRDGEDMRSHHADAGLLTQITFDFQLHDSRYRVIRVPGQERPKSRGEGTTWQQPTATLWDRTDVQDDGDEGHVLANGISKVTGQCTDLLGFSVGQFRQIVTLPQGRFREFLDADSKTREEILEKLFQTQRFSAIQWRFKSLFRDHEHLLADMKQKRATLLESVDEENADDLTATIAAHARKERDLTTALKKLKDAETKAREALEKARQEDKILKEECEAAAALRGLEERVPTVKLDETRATKAAKAFGLTDVMKAVQDATGRQKRSEGAKANARTALVDAEKQLKDAVTEHDARKAEESRRKDIAEQLTQLKPLRKKLESLDKARAEMSKHQKALAEKLGEKTVMGKRMTVLRSSKTGVARKLANSRKKEETLQSSGSELKDAETARKQLQDLQKAVKGLDALEKTREAERECLSQCKTKCDILGKEHEDLMSRWMQGQAGVLASALSEGAPCPVCGSKEHPYPAVSEADAPEEDGLKTSTQALETAQGRRDKAQEALAETEVSLSGLVSRRDTIADQLGDKSGQSLADVNAEILRLEKAVAEYQSARKRVAALDKETEDLDGQLEAGQTRLNELDTDLQKVQKALQASETSVKNYTEDLPDGITSVSDLKTRVKVLTAQGDELEKAWQAAVARLKEAEKAVTACGTALDAAESTLKDAAADAEKSASTAAQRLSDAGFVDESDYRGALLTQGQIAELQSKVDAFYKQLAAAQDRNKRAHEAADGVKKPDLDALESARGKAEKEHDGKNSELAGVLKERQQLEKIRNQLISLAKDSTEAEKKGETLSRISETINGRNDRGMTLQRYVLSTMLDQVLALASDRLRKMTANRYDLRLDESDTDRRRAGGLELAVFDEWTGEERSVKTLSGGESFLTSLALANSLSEAVQSYAGGIRLDTVFIDEGFGSLDSEALDQALANLVEIQGDGRLIGIISHVPELRARIPARLEVTATRKGSTARFAV